MCHREFFLFQVRGYDEWAERINSELEDAESYELSVED